MGVDPFELNATIKALEKSRDRMTFAICAGIGVTSWWYEGSLSTGETLIFGAICLFGLLIFLEARNTHLQGLRVSLRHLELLRYPELVHKGYDP